MSHTSPLVSCIIPTANRRSFVGTAVEYFLRQDYEHRELIVVDDGADAIGDLLPQDERVRYVRLAEKQTVGAKRNLACEQARGELIAHWDDDDWQAAHRLSYQVAALQRTGAQVCGINRLLFYDVRDGRGWQYVYPASQRLWLSGSSLLYRREFWATHRFAGVNVGEDARFVWAGRPEQLHVLPDSNFHVGIIHAENVSPKQTSGAYWSPYPAAQLKELFNGDWPRYAPEHERKVSAAPADANERGAQTMSTVVSEPASNLSAQGSHVAAAMLDNEPARPLRNVFACLVHESQECVVDLVRNLRYHEPDSAILLYNGGANRTLLEHGFPFARYGAIIHPDARPMKWGWLHGFALDCMRYALDHLNFDTLTIVDSDQMALRSGYSHYLRAAIKPKTGLLGNSPGVQGAQTRVPPAAQAWREVELWRPLLKRFPHGEEKFVHWTFWPSTVFTSTAARALVELFATDEQLQAIMRASRIWATEEVILPTLVALLGFEVAANPCSYEFVKYRQAYTTRQLDNALGRADVFWVHPIQRRYDDALRRHVRARCNHYERPLANGGGSPQQSSEAQANEQLLLTWPIIQRMRQIEGWFEDEEADLLIAITARALNSLPAPHTLVEVGSYCGRATVVMGRVAQQLAPATKLYAIDPHDGRVGALDTALQQRAPTLERFKQNIAAAGLTEMVEIMQRTTAGLVWEQPVALLLVDGWHDYANVARDFFCFEAQIMTGGFVAFHDCAPYYPGVVAFVNELLAAGAYRKVQQSGSLVVLQKSGATSDAGGHLRA
jgi:Glycosyl transferase family 2/Methyltransferase domain